MGINRKLAEHMRGRVKVVDANVERTWQAADETTVRGQGSEGRIKYQRPVNMRMSRWAGAEGVAKMRQGSGART